MPWRAIAVGSLLLPVNALWLVQMEMAASGSAHGTTDLGPYPSTLSLYANAVCFLLALSALNALLRRWRADRALSQGELLIVYVMITIGTCLASVDFLDVLFPMLGHPMRYATASNGWQSLFVAAMPKWLYVHDDAAIKAWYGGGANPFVWEYLRAWAVPVGAWCGFVVVLLGVMLCLNTLVRVRWTQHEMLSYPIIQLPLDMTDPSGRMFREPLMWAGFALAGGISILNGLHVMYPGLPGLPIKAQDLSPAFAGTPWGAMGWTPIAFYPFAVGMGFLLPVDLLFSSWFFCLAWRAERIVSAMYGWSEISPTFPYVNEQSFGAYMGVAGLALWGARRHLAAVVRDAWRGTPEAGHPMSYRMALIGAVAGTLALAGFFAAAGLPVWMALVSVAIYLAIATACTRMRAELGPPAHDLHNGGPDYVLAACLGTRGIPPQALTALTWFYWFNRAYRSIAMPYQLEAFKIAERRGIGMRGMAVALSVAAVIGLASACLALYAIPYRYGAEARMAGHFTYFGWEAFNRLAVWQQTPRDTDLHAVTAIAVGGAFTLALHAARMRLAWWPFHPLGFAVSGSFSMSTLWVPMLIAWVCKVATLRYGGLAAYNRAMAFFLGLILGDYVIGCAWPVLGFLLGVNTYSYYF